MEISSNQFLALIDKPISNVFTHSNFTEAFNPPLHKHHYEINKDDSLSLINICYPNSSVYRFKCTICDKKVFIDKYILKLILINPEFHVRFISRGRYGFGV